MDPTHRMAQQDSLYSRVTLASVVGLLGGFRGIERPLLARAGGRSSRERRDSYNMASSGCSRAILGTALALGLLTGGTGCLMSKMLGGAAKLGMVDTGIPNPDGTVQFARGATALGCETNVTDNSAVGEQLWVNCPAKTFTTVPGKLTFGFGEDKKNLTVSCETGDRGKCEDLIRQVLAAGEAKPTT